MSTKYKHSEDVLRAWQEVKEARVAGDREKARLMERVRRTIIAANKLEHEYRAMRSKCSETR